MLLTDTHTHQYYEKDLEKRAEQMQRCFDNGVKRLFLPNVDVSSIEMIDEMVNSYPENCFAMAGLHPCDVKDDYQNVLQEIYNGIADRKIYAIGEIGIDLYWDKTTLDIQIKAFEQQIDWAIEMDLPIVIHTRESFDEVFEVLERKKHPKLRGIFHCFSGNLEQAKHAVDLNFLLGIGGVVTFKNGKIDQFLHEIPLDKIVLETDSPYLAPVPHRGKRNESSYLDLVAGKLVNIYGKDFSEIDRITTENAERIFSKN